jgi:hypothetical protein
MLISHSDISLFNQPLSRTKRASGGGGEKPDAKGGQQGKVNKSLDLARELLAFLVEENLNISTVVVQTSEDFIAASSK